MRHVTRTLLATGAVLIWVVAAAAQAPGDVRPALLIREGSGFGPPGRSPAAVIERLISFDANSDQRVSRDELPERMQGLISRGDTNSDAALDSKEIRALVTAASSERRRVSFRLQSPDGLPGVIKDLKLPPAKHERALAILSEHRPPPPTAKDPMRSDLYVAMRTLLDDEEYENFAAAATRLLRNPQVRTGTISGNVTTGVIRGNVQ